MGEVAGQNPQFGAQSSFTVHFFIKEVERVSHVDTGDSGLLYSVLRLGAGFGCYLQKFGADFKSFLKVFGADSEFSVPELRVKLFRRIPNNSPCSVHTHYSEEYTLYPDIYGSVKSALSSAACHIDRNILWF